MYIVQKYHKVEEDTVHKEEGYKDYKEGDRNH